MKITFGAVDASKRYSTHKLNQKLGLPAVGFGGDAIGVVDVIVGVGEAGSGRHWEWSAECLVVTRREYASSVTYSRSA